ncbi:maleate cis-trans isomerase family protein [Actibacterium ureilyticum]|uniref:maleate cis-trans isomerase family protein n=1 Tax=Actibacterium ureilyticum TaxID=1590614 RepID=UPI000BAAF1A2|nr:aspartate/glutamate racemase family protein [Actibacterium ureilyticum]
MIRAPYRLATPTGATLGLVVLQSDETVEQDIRRLFPYPDTALHFTRIPSGAAVTPETLTQMKTDLPRAVSLLPPSASFDVIGYACTSGATMIGAAAVHALVADNARTRAVTDPLTAALAALNSLQARSIAIVSPYIDTVAAPMRRAFEAGGINVRETVSFGEETEARVARIDAASIRDAALLAARTPGIDALFLSCTNLRTLDVIDDLEDRLNLPVLSSNQVLAWHMAVHAGLPLPGLGPRRLFRQ